MQNVELIGSFFAQHFKIHGPFVSKMMLLSFKLQFAISSLVRALVSMGAVGAMLLYPQFLKVWVLAPIVFSDFCHKSINFDEKNMETISNIVILCKNHSQAPTV